MAAPVSPETPQAPSSQQNQGPKPSATPVPPVSGPLATLEEVFYGWFVAKAPFQLPVGLTDFIVKYGPWITLVLGLLFLPALFAVFTIGSIAGTVGAAYGVAYGYGPGPAYWIGLLILLAQVVIMFVSIPMLLKQRRSGWQLLFYADVINVVYGIVNSFSYGYFAIGGLIGTLISAVIAFYILFQIRRYYTK